MRALLTREECLRAITEEWLAGTSAERKIELQEHAHAEIMMKLSNDLIQRVVRCEEHKSSKSSQASLKESQREPHYSTLSFSRDELSSNETGLKMTNTVELYSDVSDSEIFKVKRRSICMQKRIIDDLMPLRICGMQGLRKMIRSRSQREHYQLSSSECLTTPDDDPYFSHSAECLSKTSYVTRDRSEVSPAVSLKLEKLVSQGGTLSEHHKKANAFPHDQSSWREVPSTMVGPRRLKIRGPSFQRR